MIRHWSNVVMCGVFTRALKEYQGTRAIFSNSFESCPVVVVVRGKLKE